MLDKKVVVVTGAAGFLGQTFIKSIVENQGIGIMTDIDAAAMKTVKDGLANTVDPTLLDCIKLDITSRDSLQSCIQYVHDKYGRIDALVNNAYPHNKHYGRHFFDVEYADFAENVGMNLGGCFLASQQFAQYFKQQGYGNIVNISSIYGVMAPRFEIYDDTEMTMPVEYAPVKAGLIHLTKYMTKYLKGMNIRVNCVSPGGILQGQPDPFLKAYRALSSNKGMLDPVDISGTLLYLLSDLSQHVNGQNIVVDDGFSV